MNDAPVAPRQAPGRRMSFALAVLMHALLAAVLIYGVHWQTQEPESVAVELVRAVPPAPTSVPAPAPELKPEPKPEPPPKPEVKPEPKPQPKPEIAQKEKPKPLTKPEPKPEPPKHDLFKDELERELKDTERRKALADAAQEQNKLKAQQASTAKASATASAAAEYIARIRGKVRGNIVLPPDIKGNPEAVLDVTQLPTGEILNVRLRRSSGSPAWDTATERAIRKSSPLPKPDRPELFARELELTFRPQDD